jgi:hypothetical protein
MAIFERSDHPLHFVGWAPVKMRRYVLPGMVLASAACSSSRGIDLSPARWPAKDVERLLALGATSSRPHEEATAQTAMVVGTSGPLAVHAGVEALRAGSVVNMTAPSLPRTCAPVPSTSAPSPARGSPAGAAGTAPWGLTRHTVPGDAPPHSTCGYPVPVGLSMTNRQVPSAWRRTTSVPRAELEVCLPSGPVLVIV